jgi:hypothetical protein
LRIVGVNLGHGCRTVSRMVCQVNG